MKTGKRMSQEELFPFFEMDKLIPENHISARHCLRLTLLSIYYTITLRILCHMSLLQKSFCKW
jgi:hypothetical protein